MKKIAICEKRHPIHIHGVFDSRMRAEEFLSTTIPQYVAWGYYMDKTLTAEDFTIREY